MRYRLNMADRSSKTSASQNGTIKAAKAFRPTLRKRDAVALNIPPAIFYYYYCHFLFFSKNNLRRYIQSATCRILELET